MNESREFPRLSTGVENLDVLLQGGVPRNSVTVVTGAPGAGKTTLVQQICFQNASAKQPVLSFNTLSEPTAKTLRYLNQFDFFKAKKLSGGGLHFVDLGSILRTRGLDEASAQIMAHVRKLKPAIVVIDSFKIFQELASSDEQFRKFGYELAVNLMAYEATVFLLGEYGPDDYEKNPLFSIVDGLWTLSQRDSLGESQRFLKIVKMRGTDHSREEHPFQINQTGIQVLAPRFALKREETPTGPPKRCRTGIDKLDEVLGPGIPYGSSLLVGGVAGTGKTVLALEFAYRGAQADEPGIYFSFEETEERLRATAKGLGWDLERELERGMLEIVFIPQPDILIESNLFMIRERIEARKAKRVVIDSVSVFLHKVENPQVAREKVFHLSSIVQNAQAVGFFTTDIPYGADKVSRLGVEETVVDGIIILSAVEEGFERQRYLEVYKLRNTAHLSGRHNMEIASGGIALFPRYELKSGRVAPPRAMQGTERLGTGVPGLDALMDGGLLRRSVTLVSGSPGVGKTTLGVQFLLEGARADERGLYVTLEEGPAQLTASAKAAGLPLQAAVKKGLVEILYVPRDDLRAGQFLSVLSDKLQALEARRVVIDSVTNVMTQRMTPDEIRLVLFQLAVRFKALEVTSLLSFESAALFEADVGTEQSLSPLADNLLMLRYQVHQKALLPVLSIIKTRGSEHDRGTHPLLFSRGGLRIAPEEVTPTSRRKAQPRKER